MPERPSPGAAPSALPLQAPSAPAGAPQTVTPCTAARGARRARADGVSLTLAALPALCWRLAGRTEPGAYPVGIWVMHAAKQVERLLPRLTGCAQVA